MTSGCTCVPPLYTRLQLLQKAVAPLILIRSASAAHAVPQHRAWLSMVSPRNIVGWTSGGKEHNRMPRTEPLKLSRPFEPVTERLRLRQWQARDFEPFAELGSVPRVMEFDHEST
jgi:hypothetical protein